MLAQERGKRAILWLTAAALHALLFLGLYQSGFTREEVHALVRPGPYKLVEPYVAAAERFGPLGVVRVYFFGESDERLYLEYARLTLHGEYDRAHVDKVQRRDTSITQLPPRPWPYRDVVVEYPPLALLAVLPPALISTEYQGYRYAFAGFMLLLHFANLALAFRLVRPREREDDDTRALAWLLVASLAYCLFLGRIVATRMDHAVVTWTLVCAWAGTRALKAPGVTRVRWAAMAGVFGALGVMTKLGPGLAVLALLIVLAHSRAVDRYRLGLAACAGGALTLLAINLGMLAFAGERYLDTFSYHTLRGVQLESVYAGVILIARALFGVPVRISESFGSTNLESAATGFVQVISPWLFIAATMAIGLRRWPSSATSLLLLTAALLLAFILTGRVFSPQYLIWLAPLLLACAAYDRAMRGLVGVFLGTALISQLIYPQGYPVLKAFHPLAVGLLNLRNFALIALAGWLVRAGSPSQRNT